MIHLDPVQSFALLGLVAIGSVLSAWLASRLVCGVGERPEVEEASDAG